ncbi:MAG: hypothetical protein RIT81_33715 [Deltaproteobacteria bacterium]
MSPRHEDDLLRYLEEDLSVAEAKALEAELAESPDLAAQLDEERALIEALAEPDDELAEIDLVAGVRERLDRREAPRRSRWFAAVGALAVAASVALVFAPSEDDGFRAKGVASTGAEKWAGVKAFVVHGDATPRPLSAELSSDDSVVFTYTNLGDSPYSHLMIFGVDEAGGVHWYYPAWNDAAANPSAVQIRPNSGDVPLPDRVAHDLPSGRYVINAVFLRAPKTVREAEALIQYDGGRFADAHVQRIEVKVP